MGHQHYSGIVTRHCIARNSEPGGLESPHALAREARPFLRFFIFAGLLLSALTIAWPVPWFAAAQIACFPLLLSAWTLWVRAVDNQRPLRLPSWLLATALMAGSILSSNSVGIFFIWVAATVLYMCVSRTASLMVCAVFALFIGVVHISSGAPARAIFIETLFALSAGAVSIALAVFLQRYARESAEKQRTLHQLKLANEQLRDLTLAQERSRIAAALHDALGHRLTSVSMSLEFAERSWDSTPERAKEEVVHAKESVIDALDEMRTVVRAIHPVQLESGGFVDTLRKIGDSFASTGLDVQVHAPSELQLDHEVERVLLAATQEALTNTVRHSGADRVVIEFTEDGTLSFADNGTGNTAPSLGFGLRSLHERVAELGGHVEVVDHGGIENGFLLKISVPVGVA